MVELQKTVDDTQFEPISWELNIVNLLLYLCVGVWVGEHFRDSPGTKPTHEKLTKKEDDVKSKRIKDLRIRPQSTQFSKSNSQGIGFFAV